MIWNGTKIKELLEQRDITVSGLADSITVTRQTVHNWLKGSLPKGQDLIKLCNFFKVGAEDFFIIQKTPVTLIAHRTHRRSATTKGKVESAHKLALEYSSFFKQAKPLGIVGSLLDISDDPAYVRKLASQIRELSGIESEKAMTYEAAFKLLSDLGIFAIFRDFPSDLKSYAFFCKIENHRVIFINSKTHVIDLIFQILHETIHAIRSEKAPDNPSEEEENVCDNVACFAQFPEYYVKKVATEIQNNNPKIIISKLRSFAGKNGHSIHGLVRALDRHNVLKLSNQINIYPVDIELREHTSTIDQVLFKTGEAKDFLRRLQHLSPFFTEELKRQIDSFSNRKLAQLLGLPSGIDAQMVREELLKL